MLWRTDFPYCRKNEMNNLILYFCTFFVRGEKKNFTMKTILCNGVTSEKPPTKPTKTLQNVSLFLFIFFSNFEIYRLNV